VENIISQNNKKKKTIYIYIYKMILLKYKLIFHVFKLVSYILKDALHIFATILVANETFCSAKNSSVRLVIVELKY
jgi:cytochrome b subunit of formate dehydrogenase